MWNKQNPKSQCRSDASASFTFDGADVVFVRDLDGGRAVVHRVSAKGGEARALVDGVDPTTSPVDRTVVFLGADDAGGARRVMITDTYGAAPRPLPGLEAGDWHVPRFSPDGIKRLLIVGSYQQVVEVTLDGSAPPKVWWAGTLDGVIAVDWAPDGDGAIAAKPAYDGDLWLAAGRFR